MLATTFTTVNDATFVNTWVYIKFNGAEFQDYMLVAVLKHSSTVDEVRM